MKLRALFGAGRWMVLGIGLHSASLAHAQGSGQSFQILNVDGEEVRIQRDAFGVPQITAESDEVARRPWRRHAKVQEMEFEGKLVDLRDPRVLGGDRGLVPGLAVQGVTDDARKAAEIALDRTLVEMVTTNPARTPRSRTRLWLDVPVAGPVRIDVYDLAGRLVKTLVDQPLGPGRFTCDWDLGSASGAKMRSAIYLVRLRTPFAGIRHSSRGSSMKTSCIRTKLASSSLGSGSVAMTLLTNAALRPAKAVASASFREQTDSRCVRFRA